MQTNVFLTEQTLFRLKLRSSRLFFSHRERKQQLTNCYTLTGTSLRSPWRKSFCLAPECRSSRSSLRPRAACAGSIEERGETEHVVHVQKRGIELPISVVPGLNNRCDHV